MSIYDYEYTSIHNGIVKMSEYKGKVLLIVNTASKCGFTPQYKGLQDLYLRYREQDFIIVGFPCNQFMAQEPDNDAEIAEFCSMRYDITFPLSKKVEVRGESAIPLYKYLTSQKKFTGMGKSLKAMALEVMIKSKDKEGYSDNQIKWNFTKFLIDRNGKVVARYEPPMEPKDFADNVKKLL